MLYRALVLALATSTHAWNDCAFPSVGYFAAEEGIGYSSGYAGAAMNGKMYMGGQTKGHFALLGITDGGGIVTPEPAATLWGDTASEVQVARTSLNPLDLYSALPQPVPLSQSSPASTDRAFMSRRRTRTAR